MVPLAFQLAESGRPRPVVIDVPKAVLLADLSVSGFSQPGGSLSAPFCPDSAIEELAAQLAAAQRPVLSLGGGVIVAGASEMDSALAHRIQAPTSIRWCRQVRPIVAHSAVVQAGIRSSRVYHNIRYLQGCSRESSGPICSKAGNSGGEYAEKNLKKVLAGIHSVCTVLPPASSRPIQGILEGAARGGVGVLFLRWFGSFEILSKIH